MRVIESSCKGNPLVENNHDLNDMQTIVLFHLKVSIKWLSQTQRRSMVNDSCKDLYNVK